jgi:hypothetical protein
VGVVSAAVSNALAAGGTGGVGMIDGAAPGISHTTAILLAIGYSLAALTTVLHVAPHRHQTRRMNRKIVIIDTLGSLLLHRRGVCLVEPRLHRRLDLDRDRIRDLAGNRPATPPNPLSVTAAGAAGGGGGGPPQVVRLCCRCSILEVDHSNGNPYEKTVASDV